MFRVILFAVCLSWTAVASAEVLDIRRLGATYWTATDSIELRVEFNRAPNFGEDYFNIGMLVAHPHPVIESVVVGGSSGVGDTLLVTRYYNNPPTFEETFIGEFPYSLENSTWSTTLPFAALGLSSLPSTVSVLVGESRPFGQTESYEGNPLRIDEFRMGYPVPESSTFALAGCAALALFAARRWTRSRH